MHRSKFKSYILGVFAVAVCWVAVPARGGLLTQYTFTTPGNVENLTESGVGYSATTVAAGLTASTLTDTSGGGTVVLEVSNAATAPASAPFLRVQPGTYATLSTNAATAVSNNGSFSFTLTPDLGSALNLTSLDFLVMRGGASTPRGYVVRTSVDGFGSNLATADVADARPNQTTVSIPLTAAFQNLTTPVTFRFYSYSTAAGSSVDYDNISVNGTVVPEPASSVLAFAVALGAVATRRRAR